MSDVHDDGVMFGELKALISRRVPGFAIKYKDESKWQKFIGLVSFFNPGYMTKYTSTIGKTVWFPSREFVTKKRSKAFKVLAHEYVHLLDRKKAPVVFELGYTFPQILFIFASLAIMAFFFSPWWLLALSALIFALPIPAIFRSLIEMRGYSMNIAINIWKHGAVMESTREWIEEVFCGWDYYKMWPFRRDIQEWIAETERRVYAIDAVGERAKSSILQESQAFVDVYALVTGIDMDEGGQE